METNVIGHVKSPNRRGFTLVRRARFCGSGFHPLPAICVRFGRLLAFPVPLSTVFSGGHDNADLCHVLGAQDLAEHSVVRLTEGNGDDPARVEDHGRRLRRAKQKQARGINLWPAKMLGRGGWI